MPQIQKWLPILGFVLLAACLPFYSSSTQAPPIEPSQRTMSYPSPTPLGSTGMLLGAAGANIPPANGRIAFLSGEDKEIHLSILNIAQGDTFILESPPSAIVSPRWSPDGKYIAFTGLTQNNTDIYVLDVSDQMLFRVTDHPAKDSTPFWSPDGRFLAFESFRKGNWDIYLYELETRETIPLTEDPAGDTTPVWSPDGYWIAFTSNRTGNAGLYLIRPDGTQLHQIVANISVPITDPTWSPDGSTLAFRLWESNAVVQICTFLLASEETRCLPQSDRKNGIPAWSPDGKTLAFRFEKGEKNGLALLDVDKGKSQVFNIPKQIIGDPTWSPDGWRLVFQVNDGQNSDLWTLLPSTGETLPLTSSPGYEGQPAWGP